MRKIVALAAAALSILSVTGAQVAGHDSRGAAYTMSNAAAANEVLVYDRAPNGELSFSGAVPTGGTGSGSGLGNQGAVTLSDDQRWLFVVNAGSNDVSVFRVGPSGLRLTDREPSGGVQPVSVTSHERFVYVLNAGVPNSISGFTLNNRGRLTPLVGSTRHLSGPATGPAQVEFSPDGRFLVVTEKGTNIIDVFTIGHRGGPIAHRTFASAGETPFGFAFGRRNQLFISEAFGGAPDASAVSSYQLARDGTLQVVTASAATTETAACWVVLTKGGRFAYATNTGSGSISGYTVGRDGELTLLDADGVTAATGPGSDPIDMALSNNGRFLYVLNSGHHTIGIFNVEADGSLSPIGNTMVQAAAASGLAAR